MSLASTPTLTAGLDPPLWPITVAKYTAMVDAGIFDKRDRVFLWKGRLASQVTIGRPHVLVMLRLSQALRTLMPEGYYVEPEAPLAFLQAQSVPEPDIKIVRGRPEDYPRDYPTTKDVPLVIEVSDKTLRDDRAMTTDYALEEIPVYWIINLPGRCVEVYTDPAHGTFAQSRTYSADERVPLNIDGREAGSIAVVDILP